MKTTTSMRLAALFSGGKDSTYATLLANRAGHDIKYLVTVHSINPDSWMWHTAAIEITKMQARAAGIPLVIVKTSGEKENELEELRASLKELDIEGVVAGAVASEYQKKRIEKVCKELGLKVLTPLWGLNPVSILNKMLDENFEIIFSAVSAAGLDRSWLGKRIERKTIDELVKLNKKYGIHISGEGGEYETLVLSCPLFSINLPKHRTIWDEKTNSGRIIF
ncbi:MAG: diphthine--ammonia ligase [Candidatus Aenigmatarchaeota archaeon]